MSVFMNKNQIFLVTTREDVVLFCNEVLHNFATIHTLSCLDCVTYNAEGIVIFDAFREPETLYFLSQAHKYKCSFIIFISPLLNEDIQRKLRLFTSYCFSSITVFNTQNNFKSFARRFFAQCHEGYNSRNGNGVIEARNETINGFFAGISPKIQNFRSMLRSVSMVDTPVFLLGETGSGKTSAAKLIHNLSARKNGPFIKVPLSEFASSISESTLFGKKEGAYTDAVADDGYFKRSNHGSLFLDEVGTFKFTDQQKLLRFGDDKAFTPVGSSKPLSIDTRIILATNANIREMLDKGTMRLDFFHRFSNNVLTIPSLRERPEDIPYIAKQYLKNNKICKFLSPTALEKLCEFSWTGNIRELNNCMERTVRDCQNERIGPDDLDFGYMV